MYSRQEIRERREENTDPPLPYDGRTHISDKRREQDITLFSFRFKILVSVRFGNRDIVQFHDLLKANDQHRQDAEDNRTNCKPKGKNKERLISCMKIW